MMNFLCAVDCRTWYLADIIFSVIGIVGTFGGAFFGAFLGYKYSIKTQRDKEKKENSQFIGNLSDELKKELENLEPVKIRERILRDTDLKIIDMPYMEKAVTVDFLDAVTYSKVKNLNAVISRMNNRYAEKNNFFDKHLVELTYFVKYLFNEDLSKDPQLLINEYNEQGNNKKEDIEKQTEIFGRYLYNCKRLLRDFNSFKKLSEELEREF